MRLIDADALFPDMRVDVYDDDAAKTALNIVSIVYSAPTIDAVPVVRCKDCWKRGGYHCPMFYEELMSYDEDRSEWLEHDQTENDGFCHLGARMDGDPDG